MRKHRLHTLTVFVGSFLALSIAFSQFLSPEFLSVSHDEVKTERHAESSASEEDASFVSLPSFSLPAPVSVESGLSPYCLFEILLKRDGNEIPPMEELSFCDRLLRTMFQVIISPNAP